MSLKNPMNYDEFKKLPTNMQYSYLKYLVDKYGITRKHICELLDISSSTFWSMNSKFDTPFMFHAGQRCLDPKGWEEFINNKPTIDNVNLETALKDDSAIEEPTPIDILFTPTKVNTSCKLHSFLIDMDIMDATAEEICDTITHLIPRDTRVSIRFKLVDASSDEEKIA